MAQVFDESEVTGNDRLILLALADEADDDGTGCYPSQDRLSHKARVPKRTVQRCLERLAEAGDIEITPGQRGRGHVTNYVVLIGRQSGAHSASPEKARKGAQRRAPLAKTFPTQDPRPDSSSLRSERARADRKSKCPEPFVVSESMQRWALEKFPEIDWREATAAFVTHARANGKLFMDWAAAWQTWVRNERKFSGRHASGPLPHIDPFEAEEPTPRPSSARPPRPDCSTCDSTGLVTATDEKGNEWADPCPICAGGKPQLELVK